MRAVEPVTDIIIIRDNNVSVYLDDGLTASKAFYEECSSDFYTLHKYIFSKN